MSGNPYLYDDDDSDLFEDEDKEKIEKTEVLNFGGKDLPKELQDKLKKFLNKKTEDEILNQLPDEIHFLAHTLDYYNDGLHIAQNGAIALAMFEALDEISNGRATAFYEFYECERQLLSTHIIIKDINELINVVDLIETHFNDVLPSSYLNVKLYLETYTDYILFTQNNVVEKYKNYCKELDKEVDEQLIIGGRKTKISKMQRILFSYPPADSST